MRLAFISIAPPGISFYIFIIDEQPFFDQIDQMK
jgi:hypothetical protein